MRPQPTRPGQTQIDNRQIKLSASTARGPNQLGVKRPQTLTVAFCGRRACINNVHWRGLCVQTQRASVWMPSGVVGLLPPVCKLASLKLSRIVRSLARSAPLQYIDHHLPTRLVLLRDANLGFVGRNRKVRLATKSNVV